MLGLTGLRPHSSLSTQQFAAHHPKIGQRKQRDELRRVFLQPALAHLDEAELAFDNPERVLHLCPNTGLELLCLFAQRAPRRVLVRLAFARPHRNVPIHVCHFKPLAGTLVIGIRKNDRFFAMQQTIAFGDIGHTAGCAAYCVHQA